MPAWPVPWPIRWPTRRGLAESRGRPLFPILACVQAAVAASVWWCRLTNVSKSSAGKGRLK